MQDCLGPQVDGDVTLRGREQGEERASGKTNTSVSDSRWDAQPIHMEMLQNKEIDTQLRDHQAVCAGADSQGERGRRGAAGGPEGQGDGRSGEARGGRTG